jgi:RNA-binding protein YhbY
MVRASNVKKLQMGKNGLSPEFLEQVRKMFESTKTIRVSLLKTATRDRAHAKEIADNLISSLGTNFRYTMVGYTLIVRRSKK